VVSHEHESRRTAILISLDLATTREDKLRGLSVCLSYL
jgi:hypothetical protein